MIRHLGIIMDGNRRFSKRLMKEPWHGHKLGREKLKEVCEWCKEYSIKELTVYAFSIQNYNRPKEEFDYLMRLFEENLDEIINKKNLFGDNSLSVKFIGRLNLLPESLQEKIKVAEEITEKGDNKLNIALSYGGREEICDMTKKVANKVLSGEITINDIDEDLILNNLYLNSEPDLIIRTGGEQRLSNFLTYQSVYSELIFVDKLWPEFSKEDFDKCIEDYKRRERRFGK